MSTADLARATGMVRSLGGEDTDVTAIVLEGAPYSKSRPRFSRNGHTYIKTADRVAEETTATQIREVTNKPFPGNVALACIFYRPNFQRIDVDNMLKHVCDAANKILWNDDSQITALLGVAEYDKDNPRTVIAVSRHVSTLLRGSDAHHPCAVCGKPILNSSTTHPRKTCSRECAARSRGFTLLDDLVPCAFCKTPFKRISKYRTFCTPECRQNSLRNKRRAAAQPPMGCEECGAPLTHRRGGRCRDCWRANPNNRQDGP